TITSNFSPVRFRKRLPSSTTIRPFGFLSTWRRIGMIKCECLFDAGDQFHGGSVDIPSQSRSVGRAHSKTNDQHGLRFAVMQRQREMRHELRSRRKRRHAYSVNEKLTVKAVPGRND